MTAMARAIPAARLVEIEGAGHVTPLEASAEVGARLTANDAGSSSVRSVTLAIPHSYGSSIIDWLLTIA